MSKKLFSLGILLLFSAQVLLSQVSTKVEPQDEKKTTEEQNVNPVSKPIETKKPAVTQPAPAPKPTDFYELYKSSQVSDRRKAIDNIGRKRDSKDAQILIDALSDSDSGVKVSAIDSLGLMREQLAADKIILALKDKEPQVRQSACVALGYIGDSKAQPALVERVKNDSSNSVRTQAILILGNMHANIAVDTLIPLLKDKNLDVCYLSAEALGKIGDPKATSALKNCLANSITEMKNETDSYRNNQYKRLITVTAKALGNLKDKSSEDTLIGLLDNNEKSIKIAAASALGSIGNNSGLSVAMKLAEDSNEIIKIQAIEALGNIGDPAAIPVLETIADNDPNNNIKETARASLYRVGWKPAPPKKPTSTKPAQSKPATQKGN